MALHSILLKIKGTINNWLTELDANAIVGSFQRSESLYTVSGSTYELNIPTNISKVKIQGSGTIIGVNTTNRVLGTQFTLRFTTVVTVKHGSSSVSPGYSAFSLVGAIDKTFQPGDMLIVEMAGVTGDIAILEEIEYKSSNSAITNVNPVEEVTNDYYLITSNDIKQGWADVPLTKGAIAPNTHLFAWLQNVPLSITTINSLPILNSSGSVSYTEGEETVKVDFTNANDFGQPDVRYSPEIGWVIMIKYSRLVPNTVIVPTSTVTIEDVVGTLNVDGSISFLVSFANTGAAQNVTVRYVFSTGGTTISSVDVPEVAISDSSTRTKEFSNLDPNTTYRLTATVLQTLNSDYDEVTTNPVLQAKFRKDEIALLNRTSTTAIITQSIDNIGEVDGTFELYLTLEDDTNTEVAISPILTKNILSNGSATFSYEFEGITTGAYTAYSKYEDTIFTYNIAEDYYTRL